MSATKRCSECGEVKPKAQFPRSVRHFDGRSSSCLLCHEKHLKFREGADYNPDQRRAIEARWETEGRSEGLGGGS
jgi:hypothetical protein